MPAFNSLPELNSWLEPRSYVEGYAPSKQDAVAFDNLKSAPPKEYPHALRWYNHIKSYSGAERSKFGEGSAIVASSSSSSSAATSAKGGGGDDDEDVDLFGDSGDEDDAEKEKVKQERLKAYAEKKSKKPGPIAKSNVIFDVKPWDDETDLAVVEKSIRGIACDGLIWGPSKLMPVAFGIKKLQIGCVVEDEKVSVDWLEEQISSFEDFVQSVDIAAFNKI